MSERVLRRVRLLLDTHIVLRALANVRMQPYAREAI
jgi:hypothetical protein